ncbi:hypothetical protein PHYPSEUDO_014092 [Phytophthora pseudosyringae]|uniref:Uncharacterized protein n=1 Tax=Phytophthora pseudosyringae TaxID=221518 RepID=A0A8T1W5R0_9STRA|nr:hypothetical protein PHYPSEUDO_014092 [Phytophthora pseudosyringae]
MSGIPDCGKNVAVCGAFNAVQERAAKEATATTLPGRTSSQGDYTNWESFNGNHAPGLDVPTDIPERSNKRRRAPVDDTDEEDLLRHLDLAHRREKWRTERQRSRLQKNHEARLDDTAPVEDTPRHFHPLSKEEQSQCMELLRRELGADGLDECACAICDRLVLRREVPVVMFRGYFWSNTVHHL